MIAQYEVKTVVGKYRLDFVVELDDVKIGFECDGKEYHDVYRDEWRDGMILDTGDVDVIYRFRGKDIFTFIDDCIYVVYMLDPEMFNDRYPHFCEKLASENTVAYFVNDDSEVRNHEDIFLDMEFKDDLGVVKGIMSLHCVRRSKLFHGHWKKLVDFSKANPGRSLDELIALYKSDRFI